MEKNDSGEIIYPFRNQNFKNIRDWCLRKGYLFEDPYFKLDRKYEWKRPYQIVGDPQLFVGGVSRFDIVQGDLGDCWMLASIATLAMQPNLLEAVVPRDQSFSQYYAGVFHIRIWQFGRWFDVVIDDRLPTVHGELVNVKSQSKNEFWSALLEKAYCKVLGGEYLVADAGNLCEALEDFTGGVVKQFYLRDLPTDFENILLRSVNKRSLIGCYLSNLPGTTQCRSPAGLVAGHSYSVTSAKRVNIPDYGNVVLVRVRNPWGEFEWRGAWSDNSPEWRAIPSKTKEKLGLVFENDGEFWMSYSDFISNFEWIDMCHLSPGVFSNVNQGSMSWQLNMTSGSWVRGVTAGGGKAMHMNIQVRLTLSVSDDDNADGLCSVLVALLQRPKSRPLDYNEIGFRIYQVDDPRYYSIPLDRAFFRNHHSVAQVPVRGTREVAEWFNLLPGVYCVIPYTYETGKEGQFLLRIFSEKKTIMDTLDYRIGLSPETVKDRETPPMKITDEDAKNGEDKSGLCDEIMGGNVEVGWKELKDALDIAVKKDISISAEKGGEHVLIDMANFVYNKFFGSSEYNAFKTIGREGFSKDICRSMVALLDVNHSGKLSADELQSLGEEIKKCKLIYELYSKDTGGYLNSSGLKEALETTGFQLNNRILGDIAHKYADKNDNIPFDDFLYCVIKLKNMSEFFKSKEENDSHKAEFTFEEFIEKVVYS